LRPVQIEFRPGCAPGNWLVWACSEQTGEEKFLLSNASADSGVELLMRVAFRRAHVEHAFRMCKSALGFAHFEGRNYVALRRHLSLCVATMVFVSERTQRLRGKNLEMTIERVCRALG
jgi:SRSO17 transposase